MPNRHQQLTQPGTMLGCVQVVPLGMSVSAHSSESGRCSRWAQSGEIKAAGEMLGGGQGYADAINLIGERLGSVADLGAEALTQSFVRENARENTDRLIGAHDELLAVVQELEDSLDDTRRELVQAANTPKAA